MTEIEKIKADLKNLEDFKDLALRLGFSIEKLFYRVRLDLINKPEKAEKQPKDPRCYAKNTYHDWTTDHPLEDVADYICFLEKENRCLVAKLESRPVVWMLRSKYTGILEMTGDHPDIYCLEHAKQFNPNSYSMEPYEPTRIEPYDLT